MRGDREEAIRLLSETKLKLREISERTEVPLGSLGELSARYRGVKSKGPKVVPPKKTHLRRAKWLEKNEDIIHLLKGADHTLHEIAEMTDVPYWYVVRLSSTTEREKTPRRGAKFGERGAGAVMTDEWIHEHAIEKNLTLHEMGEILGVSRERVRQILEKKGMNIGDLANRAKRYWNKWSEKVELTPVNMEYFDVIDTEEKAYWLGYLTAKARVVAANDHGRLQLTMNIANQNLDHVMKFLKTVEADVEVNTLEGGEDKQYVNYGTHIKSHYLASKLQEYFLESPKHELTHIPEELPHELKRHYLRGHFDGKGFIWKNEKKEKSGMLFMRGSDPLLYDFCEYITSNLDIKLTDKCVRPPDGGHQYYTFAIMRVTNITAIINHLYEGATIYHPRNLEKFKQVFEG